MLIFSIQLSTYTDEKFPRMETNLFYLVLTITELVLDDHVVVLGPGRVVANQMRMRAKYRMGTHFAECCRSVVERERERERETRKLMGEGVV